MSYLRYRVLAPCQVFRHTIFNHNKIANAIFLYFSWYKDNIPFDKIEASTKVNADILYTSLRSTFRSIYCYQSTFRSGQVVFQFSCKVCQLMHLWLQAIVCTVYDNMQLHIIFFFVYFYREYWSVTKPGVFYFLSKRIFSYFWASICDQNVEGKRNKILV